MGRAHGHNAVMLFAYEPTTYGTAPASGAYRIMPFVSSDLGLTQDLVDDDVLGLGRDPQAPTYDLKRVGGSVVVPLDLRNIGYWLSLVFGDPTTTGASAPYTHVWVSGAAQSSMKSAAIEIQLAEVPAYFLNEGVRANSIQFGLSRSGKLQATIELIGQDETKATSSVDATPDAAATISRFDVGEANIMRNAAALANVLTADMTYSNNMESVDTMRADALTEGVDVGVASLMGSLNTRFAATTLYDDALAQSALDILFSYTISASQLLTVEAQSAYLPVSKRSISGPGGIEASFSLQGAVDSSEGEMLEITLKNDLASYVNAS